MPQDETVQRSLGRLEGKLDSILDAIKARDEKDERRETRLRTVEQDISSVKTTSGLIASGSAFLVSLAATVLPNVFHK